MLILGWEGMPRRYFDYLPQYETLNRVAGIGAFVMVLGILITVINLVRSIKTGWRCEELDPWGGGRTLEWTVPSPPPLENFDEIPEITRGAYEAAPTEAR